MKAYYVYDAKKALDLIIIPETDRMVKVDRHKLELFISVSPAFSELRGRALNGISPEALGAIAATRDGDGDVCVVDARLWQNRLNEILGHPLS